MKRRYILRGGSTHVPSIVLRGEQNRIYINKSKAKCNTIKDKISEPKDKIHYCRRNRSECQYESKMDQTYKNKELFDEEKYEIMSCYIEDSGIAEVSERPTLDNYDTIIIGAGPVGLYAGIRMKQKFKSSNVLIIEQRESYTRKEIFMIQDNKDNKDNQLLKGITLLEDCKLLQKLLKNGGAWVSHPVRDNIAVEAEKDDRNPRMAITVGNFEFTLEQEFLELGGHIVRPAQVNKKLTVELEKNTPDFLSLRCDDSNMILLTGDDTFTLKSQIEISKHKNLICADGSKNSFRFQLNNDTFRKLKEWNDIFEIKPYSHTSNFEEEKKKKNISTSIEQMNDTKHDKSDCYALVFNFDITEENTPIINEFSKQISHSEKLKHGYRLFIVGDNGYFAIQISKGRYNEYYTNPVQIDEDRSEIAKVIDISESQERIRQIIFNDILSSTNISPETLGHFFNLLNKVQIFPISIFTMAKNSMRNTNTIGINVAWIGDAAVGVHFFSGSGVNLGLQSVDILVKNVNNEQGDPYNFETQEFDAETQDLYNKVLASSKSIIESFLKNISQNKDKP